MMTSLASRSLNKSKQMTALSPVSQAMAPHPSKFGPDNFTQFNNIFNRETPID
jgi:hypothetical protein